jgi:hypothetical protein
MFGSDVIVIELARFFKREFDDALGARRENHLLLNGLAAASDDRFDFLTHLRQIDAERFEHFRREALALGNNSEQNVLRTDVVVSKPLRLFLRQHDAAARALGKRFPH